MHHQLRPQPLPVGGGGGREPGKVESAPDRKSPGKNRWPNWRRPATRSYQEIISPRLTKPGHARLVIGKPRIHLLAAEFARRRQLACAAQPGSQKQKEFLLLLRRERIHSRFNFNQRAHDEINLSSNRANATPCSVKHTNGIIAKLNRAEIKGQKIKVKVA